MNVPQLATFAGFKSPSAKFATPNPNFINLNGMAAFHPSANLNYITNSYKPFQKQNFITNLESKMLRSPTADLNSPESISLT
jgi:hypothetical protein